MPWKVFQQSLALINSGEHWANKLYRQRENALCSLNIAPKWGDSLFELFCCHLEIHFEVIQEKTAHVDPSTPCYCVQSMLYKRTVSGLVVSRMETVLEHGCLDIVAFLPFFKRDGLNPPSNLCLVHLVFSEVSPSLLSIWTFKRYLPLALFDWYRRLDFRRCLVCDLQGVFIQHIQVKS